MENEPQSSIELGEEEELNAGRPVFPDALNFGDDGAPIESEAETEDAPLGIDAPDANQLPGSNESGDGGVTEALRNARPSWEKNIDEGHQGYKAPPLGKSPWHQGAGSSNFQDYQPPFPEAVSTETTATTTDITAANFYSFEMFDASDKHRQKVRIRDGLVFGPNDDGNLPQGMGNDDFEIDVGDNEEIWLIIPIDADTGDVVTPITIDSGAATPDDTDAFRFVTIGQYIVEEDNGAVTVSNSLCGDYVIPHAGIDVVNEDGVVTTDVDSIQFTTNGSEFVDVFVQDDGPGQVSVIISASDAASQIINFFNNLPPNSVVGTDPNGNPIAIPLTDCNDL